MSTYFSYFPLVTHSSQRVLDISRRAKIRERLQGNPYLYLPYTIKGDEKPEDIANYYYSDVNKTWMVLLANDIVDVYSQWPKTTENFEKYLQVKYAESANTTGQEVLEWTQNQTIDDNIVHYKNNEDQTLLLSPQSTSSDEFVLSEWSPVRVYEYEFDLNESKRIIYLFNVVYAEQIESELQRVMNE